MNISIPESSFSLYILPIHSVPKDLEGLTITAVNHHVTGPTKELILEKYLSKSAMHMKVVKRDEMPSLPVELLSAYGTTKQQIATLNKAQHFIMVKTEGAPATWSPENEIVAMTVVGALASELNSFVVDLFSLKIKTPEGALAIQSGKKAPTMSAFLNVLQSNSENGSWMTTKGLQRFGFPELQVIDVAPQLSDNMAYLMTGLAWKILKDHRGAKSGTIKFASPIILTREDISEAYGEETKNNKDSAPVYLCLDEGDQSHETFLTIRAPEGEKKPLNQYLTELCSAIFGKSSGRSALSPRSKAMEEAMKTARAELPSVRKRFISGKLPKRSQLIVKFGVGGKRKEYLWAAITDWSDEKKPRGHCGNDAVEGSDLRAGQPLTLDSDSIVDWAVMINDDIVEGARTNKVLEKEAKSHSTY